MLLILQFIFLYLLIHGFLEKYGNFWALVKTWEKREEKDIGGE